MTVPARDQRANLAIRRAHNGSTGPAKMAQLLVASDNRNTIMDAMVAAGEKCQPFLENTVRGINVTDVQADRDVELCLLQGEN